MTNTIYIHQPEKAVSFTRLPNFLFEAPTFIPLSNEAKVLYAFILRRTDLSRKNGWINGMRFLIRREAPEEGDAFFHAWVWPGPLIFSLTDDSLKTDFTAPFTNEGKQQVVDWINAQYEDHPEKWSHEKKNLY